LCGLFKVELLIGGAHVDVFWRGADAFEFRPRPFELVQLLWREFERDEIVHGQACFEHGVGVHAHLPVVAPLELFEVVGLKVHGEHVIKGEAERRAVVDRVGYLVPGNLELDEVFGDEPLLLERGERRAEQLRQLFPGEKVARALPYRELRRCLAPGVDDGVEREGLMST
tara:strand:- start:1350 stop:1859 length:510 start_codon:yes stop_codon:yes gene_type:complete